MINTPALRREWASNRRRALFFWLPSLQLFLTLLSTLGLLLQAGPQAVTFLERYSQWLYVFIPLSQLRGWAWEKSRGTMDYNLALPLKEWRLALESLLCDIQGFLWFLITPLLAGSWYWLILSFQPLRLLLFLVGLLLQGLLLISFSSWLSALVKGVLPMVLLGLLGSGLLYLLQYSLGFSIQAFTAGYLYGQSLVVPLLVSAAFLILQSLALKGARRR